MQQRRRSVQPHHFVLFNRLQVSSRDGRMVCSNKKVTDKFLFLGLRASISKLTGSYTNLLDPLR